MTKMQDKNLGTISDLITYFNQNRQIFQKQRKQKEHMERVMCMLSQQNMQVLEREFRLYPKGLQLPTFIYLMKKLYEAQDQLAEYFFVSDLIKFFQAIDINGDGHLQWSEFTEYIIENIRRTEKPRYKNKTYEENEIISSAYSKISNEYKIAKVVDANCNNLIRKIVYVSKLAEYYLLESNTNIIKIFDQNFEFISSFPIVADPQAISSNAFIVDFAFDKQNQIFGALFGNSYCFCNMKAKTAIKFINEVQSGNLKSFHKVQHLPLHSLWSTISKNGQIRLSTISYKSRTQIQYQLISCFKQHESMVTDIVQIQQPLYICTSSMDGNIKFYSKQLQKSLEFEHISDQTASVINSKFRKGILGIDYTREFGSYVLSYGFSSSIYVYSLDISVTKGYSGSYNEHSGALITARFLKAFPYVLSFDDKLNLRIWDFRKFSTIQIINCQKHFINPSKLQIIPELSQCLICEKKITQLRAPALQKKSKQINEFHQIFDFKLCALTSSIFIFSSTDVRIYDYLTGSLKKVFTKLNQNRYQTNITAAQFGHKARKFFVGDAAGFVREYCSQTGDFLQEIKPNSDVVYENKQIVKIIFLREHSLLICCSMDGRLLIYQKSAEGEFEMVRDIRESHEQLTCAAATGRYCLLATGGQDGSLNVWGLQKFNIEAVLMLKNRILCINFSPIHPLMLVVEQVGTINLFHVRPLQQVKSRYQCFAKLVFYEPITSFFFDLVINNYIPPQSEIRKIEDSECINEQPHHLLGCIGTECGKVEILDLNPLLKEFNIKENHQLFCIGKSIRSEVQNIKSVLQSQRRKILQYGHSYQTAVEYNLSLLKRRQIIDAHSDRVQHLNLVKQNSVLLTTSTDKKLKLWSLTGELYGMINFSTFKKSNWKIPQVNFHRKIQQIETTLYSIRLIQNKKLLPDREEFIRVNLLLHEYMDKREQQAYIQWVREKQILQGSRFLTYSSTSDLQDTNTLQSKHEEQAISVAQFNQIYNKLVSGITQQLSSFSHSFTNPTLLSSTLNKSESIYSNSSGSLLKKASNTVVSVDSRFQKPKSILNSVVNTNTNTNSNVNQIIRETLGVGLKKKGSHNQGQYFDEPSSLIGQIKKSEEKQYEQLFGKRMKKQNKSKPKFRNMLLSSLNDVKRGLKCMERIKDKRK